MITASIVTYNTEKNELATCLSCLAETIIDTTYIIDNSSQSYIKDICSEYPNTIYIANDNVGYGAGHNIAIRNSIQSAAEYHLVLNSDIQFSSNVISELIGYMDAESDVAQVQPKIISPDGSEQYTCRLLPTPCDLIFRRFLPKWMSKKSNNRYLLRFANRTNPINVPYQQGSFMLFRTRCFQDIGLFDERFFMYPEDIDITRRMHRKYRTMYYPYATVTHAHRAASYHSAKMLWIHICNMIKYFNKWGWVFDKERKTWNRQLLQSLGYYSTEKVMLPKTVGKLE